MGRIVYVAGPLFSEAERSFLEKMVDILARYSGLNAEEDFFIPHRDGGELGKGPKRKDIFHLDLNNLDRADIVVSLLDGQDVDSGTCIELGYAFARGKKIFGIITDFRAYCTQDEEPHKPNLMVWGVCEEGITIHNQIDKLAEAFSEYVIDNKIKGTIKTTV